VTSAAPPAAEASLFTRHRQREAARIVIVGIVTALFWRGVVPMSVLLGAVALGLYPLAKGGLVELWRERKVGTELFVTIATLIAVAGKEYVAASVLMTIILIAEFIADLNTDRARASIKALIGAAPRTATVRTDAGERVLDISEVAAGMVVLVRAGEKIPVDGTVVGGEAAVDEAPITGESLPVQKAASAAVLAGTIVSAGALDVRCEKVGAETLFARIVSLVEDAESEAAPVQKLADKVAAWLLPAILVFLVTVFVVTHDIRKIVALLIFTSPAELGLATPMVMIAGIARAARHGILVKGGLYLELLAKVDTFVFDKTGTLTQGEPEVINVVVYDPKLNEEGILRYAAAADLRSAHPLARAVVKAARARNIDIPEVQDFKTIHGRGVAGVVDAREILLGNEALLDEHSITGISDGDSHAGSIVHLAVNGRLAGSLQFADKVREGTAAAIERLRGAGVRRFVMLTGDNAESAAAVGKAIGIDDVRARLLPEEKIRAVEALQREGHTVAMVGDGVNDAPALARADVGIAMGAKGTHAALEAADVALMTDDLRRLVTARLLARRAYRTIKENLIVGVGVVHVLGITAALAGWIGPIQAAMLHLGPDVLVFLNSVKLLRVKLEDSPLALH
jgi:Zn2+/Cd2+-exporting ATPase